MAKVTRSTIRLGRRLSEKYKATTIQVGFMEGATYPAEDGKAPVSVAQVAYWNEYGTDTAPARPFMRKFVADNRSNWSRLMAAAYLNYGKSQAAALVGQALQEQLQQSINTWPKDNRPSTVERKGFNKGLIGFNKVLNETAHMMRSVTYTVEEG